MGWVHYNEKSTKGRRYDEKIKQAVEEFLTDPKVTMHIYRVLPFNPGINPKDHRSNVNNTEQLERAAISAFTNSGKSIMNKAQIKSAGPCPFPEVLMRIKSEFNL